MSNTYLNRDLLAVNKGLHFFTYEIRNNRHTILKNHSLDEFCGELRYSSHMNTNPYVSRFSSL